MEINKLYNENCLIALKKLPDNCIDEIVTDPPYALTSIVKRFGKEGSTKAKFGEDGSFQRLGKGFMGKTWDSQTPSVEIWQECLRVMKPGAFAFICMTPRQDSLSETIMRLHEAGFNTSFSSIYWTYASGFPKAHNVGRMIDAYKKNGKCNPKSVHESELDNPTSEKDVVTLGNNGILGEKKTMIRGKNGRPQTEEAQNFTGAFGGFQPKPAVEIIIVAMKPLEQKTYVAQALDNGKGVTWMDDCRIPYTNNDEPQFRNNATSGFAGANSFGGINNDYIANNKGRFPANLLVSDDILNNGNITKSNNKSHDRKSNGLYAGGTSNVQFSDEGSYSRYFYLDRWFSEKIKELPEEVQKTFPFIICAKASKKEKNRGCENLDKKKLKGDWFCKCKKCGRFIWSAGNKNILSKCDEPEIINNSLKNNHPTVKPLKLLSYLITLGSRPGDIVLDPFAGSGTTLLASKNLNRNYIGCEMDKEYCEIIKARLNGTSEEIIPSVKSKKEKPKKVIEVEENIFFG